MSDDPKPAREWLKGKTAADLDLIEFGGRIYFSDVVHRLRKGGKFESVSVAVCVPRPPERALARRDAIALAAKWKLDREKDADLFEMIDRFAILAHAIRTVEEPHGQFQPLEWLISIKPEEGFDVASLVALHERLEVYDDLLDPRITEPMTEDEVMEAAFAIDRVRNLSPLVGTAGRALVSCVTGMASILCKYRLLILSQPSSENSTPAP